VDDWRAGNVGTVGMGRSRIHGFVPDKLELCGTQVKGTEVTGRRNIGR